MRTVIVKSGVGLTFKYSLSQTLVPRPADIAHLNIYLISKLNHFDYDNAISTVRWVSNVPFLLIYDCVISF